MRKSSNITLSLVDIIDFAIPTHEGRVGDFKMSLVDIVLEKIGGEELFPNLHIDEFLINRYGQRLEVQYSWEVLPKMDVERMEKVVLEIMEKIYDSRPESNWRRSVYENHRCLESEIRDVFTDNFEPMEE